jgi:hypothetical protein
MFDFLLRYAFRDRKWHMAHIIYHRCQKRRYIFRWRQRHLNSNIFVYPGQTIAANVTSNQWLFTAGNNDTGRQCTGRVVMSKRIFGKKSTAVLGIRIRIRRIRMFLGLQDPDPSPKSTFRTGWVHRKKYVMS